MHWSNHCITVQQVISKLKNTHKFDILVMSLPFSYSMKTISVIDFQPQRMCLAVDDRKNDNLEILRQLCVSIGVNKHGIFYT